MSDYEIAFQYLMDDEDRNRSGAIVSDPEPGAPDARARFGLNSFWHDDLLTAGYFTFNPDATPKIPNEEALAMAASAYRAGEWSWIRGDGINNQDVANKFLSLAVNSGAHEATKIVQRAVNRALYTLPGELGLHVDGVCGEQTLAAINKADHVLLLPMIKSYAVQFYKDCGARLKWSPRELAAHLNRANR
jgi:hypothetical protein